MSKNKHINRSRSRKGGRIEKKEQTITLNPSTLPIKSSSDLPIKDKSISELNDLLNKYKNKPSLESLNNYAKFLSLGFTSFIKNGKITLLEQYGSFLQKDGAISFDESVSRFNTTVVEINEYANKQLGSDTTLGSASELFGKSINESPDLFVEYSSVIRFAWELSADDKIDSLLPSMSQQGGTVNELSGNGELVKREPVRRNRLLAFTYIIMFIFSIFAIYQQISGLTNTISDLYSEYGETDINGNIFNLTVVLQIVGQLFTGAFEATIIGFGDIALERLQLATRQTFDVAQRAQQQTWDRGFTNGITGLLTGATQSEVVVAVDEQRQFEQRRALEDATRAINLRFRDLREDISSRWSTLIIGLHMLPTSTILMLNYINPNYVNNITAALTMGAMSSSLQSQGFFAMTSLFTNYSIAGRAIYRSIRGIEDPLRLTQQEQEPNVYVFSDEGAQAGAQEQARAIRDGETVMESNSDSEDDFNPNLDDDETNAANLLGFANSGKSSKGGKKTKKTKKNKKTKKAKKNKKTKKAKKNKKTKKAKKAIKAKKTKKAIK